MDKRTVLRAYRAAKSLEQVPHGMKAGLQLVRLQGDLEEGSELDEAQQNVLESYGGVGAEVSDEEAEEFRAEMQDLLDGEADTSADDVRHLDLSQFGTEGGMPEGQWGNWIRALIDVGCVEMEEAMDILESMEEGEPQ